MLAVNKVPLLNDQHIPTLISLGSNLGGMLPLWSSALLVRVSDEPGAGTTDYCCTFTAKGGERKAVEQASDVFIGGKYRESSRSCALM